MNIVGETDRWILGACCPASLAESVSAQSTERQNKKKVVTRTSDVASCLRTYAYTYAPNCTHTYKFQMSVIACCFIFYLVLWIKPRTIWSDLTTTFIQIKYIFRIQIRKLFKETPLTIKQILYLQFIYNSKEVREYGIIPPFGRWQKEQDINCRLGYMRLFLILETTKWRLGWGVWVSIISLAIRTGVQLIIDSGVAEKAHKDSDCSFWFLTLRVSSTVFWISCSC